MIPRSRGVRKAKIIGMMRQKRWREASPNWKRLKAAPVARGYTAGDANCCKICACSLLCFSELRLEAAEKRGDFARGVSLRQQNLMSLWGILWQAEESGIFPKDFSSPFA